MAGQGIPPMVTAAPKFKHRGRIPFGDGLDKRQDFTFTSCGLECDVGNFCQGYRTNYGACCPTSVLTRTAANYCAPATGCVEYVTGASADNYSYDSTASVQYCGSARPYCATYIYTKDSYSQLFCGSEQSGAYFFDYTSSRAAVATFIGGTTTTSSTRSLVPSASVIRPTITESSSTSSNSAGGQTSGSTPISSSTQSSSSGGVSKGAVAGIAVGAALAVGLLLLGAFFLWRRSKKPKPEASNQFANAPQPPMGHNPQTPISPYDATSPGVGGYAYPHANQHANQMQHPQYSELPQNPQGQEFYKAPYPVGAPGHQPPPQTQVFELGGGGGNTSPGYQQGGQAPLHTRAEVPG